MKYRAYAILVVITVAAAILAFVLPGGQGQTAAMMAVTFAVITAFSVLISWPPGGALVERKPHLFKALGGIVEALAVLVFAWSFAVATGPRASPHASNIYITASVILCLTGMLLFMAPRTARQSREAGALRDAQALADRPTPDRSGADGNAAAALVCLAKNLRPFLQMAWLWLLLSSGSLILGGWAWAAGYVEPYVQVAALGVGWLAFVVGLPVVMVAWHRWLIDGRPPTWAALPDRTAFAYGWRLWIYVSIANRAANGASEAAGQWALHQHFVPAFAPAALVNALTFTVVCALFGIQAIRLAAVALGDRAFSLSLALVAARKSRFTLPLGILLTFAPFFALRVLIEILLFSVRQTVAEMEIMMAMEFALQFLAFAAAAILISATYVKARIAISDWRAGSQ